MPVEVGSIVEGKVTGITKFGAFIELGDGTTGLCHISEISDSYVKEVSDVLKENQEVKVKIIAIDPKGKVSLSIRKAQEKPAGSPSQGSSYKERNRDESRSYPDKRSQNAGDYRKPQQNPRGFEDMLSSFLKESDDKLRDIKKQKASRRGNSYNTKR